MMMTNNDDNNCAGNDEVVDVVWHGGVEEEAVSGNTQVPQATAALPPLWSSHPSRLAQHQHHYHPSSLAVIIITWKLENKNCLWKLRRTWGLSLGILYLRLQDNMYCWRKSIAKGTKDPRHWVLWPTQQLKFKAKASTRFEIFSLVLFGKGQEILPM